ncbi:metalloenzyme [Gracilariopsis chorda]|nr:metalloenzyme [Gracilariopsis chorda]
MVTTMDRYEADWGVVESGWRAHCRCDTSATFKSRIDAVEHSYKDDDMVDQYMPPFVIVDDDGNAVGPMSDGDSVLFWNFRGDRAIEISTAIEAEEGEFHGFDRKRVPDVRYAGMMQYDGNAGIPKRFLVSPSQIERTVGEYVVKNGTKRFSVSETQKQREHTRPWMKAAQILDSILDEIDNFKPDLMVVNYANGDTVGHTGHMVASRLAMECVDLCLARVVPEIIKRGGVVILTADHGNCDIMAEVGKDGKPKAGNQPEGWKAKVPHTKQRVPCMIIGNEIDKYEIDTSEKWGEEKECKCPGIANLGLPEPTDYLPSVLVPRGERFCETFVRGQICATRWVSVVW